MNTRNIEGYRSVDTSFTFSLSNSFKCKIKVHCEPGTFDSEVIDKFFDCVSYAIRFNCILKANVEFPSASDLNLTLFEKTPYYVKEDIQIDKSNPNFLVYCVHIDFK